MPPQPSTLQSPNPSNTPTHAQYNKTSHTYKTPQPSSPTQPKQQSTVTTDVNQSTQPFIPAAEIQPVSSTPQQNLPKLANGEGVKHSKQQM